MRAPINNLQNQHNLWHLRVMLEPASDISLTCAINAVCVCLQGGVPSQPQMSAALQLFELNTVCVMREMLHDTKVLLASGLSAIVLSFRGTSSAAAVRADVQVPFQLQLFDDAPDSRKESIPSIEQL